MPACNPGPPDSRPTIGYEHDSLGLTRRIFDRRDGETFWRGIEYDAHARVTAEELGNGVRTERTYDDETLRVERVYTHKGGEIINDIEYKYDLEGNLSERTVNGRVHEYEYDGRSRLEKWSIDGSLHAEYEYDKRGNLRSYGGRNQTFDSDAPHQLTSSGGEPVSYDDRGRRLNGSGWRVVGYTRFDQPKSIRGERGVTTFRYDAMGHRAQKRSGADVTRYAGNSFEHRVSSDSQTLVSHLHGPSGLTAQLVRDDDGETTRYIHPTRKRSVEGASDAPLSDVASGSTRLAYSPFGRRVDDSGLAVSTPDPSLHRGFEGQEHDEEAGLIYFGGRMYDPATGSFLTPDPFVAGTPDADGLNPYSYVRNNPTNSDPTGLLCDDGDSDATCGNGPDWSWWWMSRSPSAPPAARGSRRREYRPVTPDNPETFGSPGRLRRTPPAHPPPPPDPQEVDVQGASQVGGVSGNRQMLHRFSAPAACQGRCHTPQGRAYTARELGAVVYAIGLVLGSIAPGGGETLDFQVYMDNSAHWFDRTIAGGSLIASVPTRGLLPNWGALVRGRRAIDAATEAARRADRVADLGRGRFFDRAGRLRNADGTFASGGNTAVAAAGRRAHTNYQAALGKGYRYEVRIPGVGRADAVDFKNRVVRELKPDNPRAIVDGWRQVERYRRELQATYGGQWRAIVDVYKQ